MHVNAPTIREYAIVAQLGEQLTSAGPRFESGRWLWIITSQVTKINEERGIFLKIMYIHAAFPVPKPGLRTNISIGESGVRTENNNESRVVGSNPTWSI